ncbi:hypothetical protein PInf_005006 [Phytophthora infestans]|nr:hypothetical protein PInf_005006 [Phytophthora infestans]
MSDQFTSYVSVNGKHTLANNRHPRGMNYKHMWVNHSKTYVDPIIGAHTNRVEGAWEIRIEQHVKAMRGMKKELLPMYLDEYMWRNWFASPKANATEVLHALIKGIVKYYY